MFGKQLANPAYPKMDTGVNPISLIKVGLIDPKNGIVAPNEPQLVIEKPTKLTLSEKICYTLVVLFVVGGLTALVTYRICKNFLLLFPFFKTSYRYVLINWNFSARIIKYEWSSHARRRSKKSYGNRETLRL